MTFHRIRGRFGAPLVALVAVAGDRGHGDRQHGQGEADGAEKYVLGVSNTLVGNGWREEMICAVKAQALASGKVSRSSSPTATAARRSRTPTSAT